MINGACGNAQLFVVKVANTLDASNGLIMRDKEDTLASAPCNAPCSVAGTCVDNNDLEMGSSIFAKQ